MHRKRAKPGYLTSRGQTGGRPKRKVSQARLAGNIPLVNTSSEEEDEAEDSFDRQIADSLAVARPMELLVRGSSLRYRRGQSHWSSDWLDLDVADGSSLMP